MDSTYANQRFFYDKTFDPNYNTQTIYKEVCRGIVQYSLSGFNSTIFMYGQTTSGKTYTMLGTHENPGILPCTLRDIFNNIKSSENSYNVYCSYVEIYNENLFDLLQNNSPTLKLIDDSKVSSLVSLELLYLGPSV